MIKQLIKDEILNVDDTIYYHSDGATNHYRCAKTLNFLSILAVPHKINISRATGAPVHQKGKVDGIQESHKKGFDRHY